MKGHQILTLREAGVPIDDLVDGALVPAPTRGPLDNWAVERVCTGASAALVLLRDVEPERHTSYTPSPDCSDEFSARWSLMRDVADEFANTLHLISSRFSDATSALAVADDTIASLEQVGVTLMELLTLQHITFGDLGVQVSPDVAACDLLRPYVEARSLELDDLCVRFAARWWPVATSRPLGTRLTFFSVDTFGAAPDISSTIVAADPIVESNSWVVVCTPRLTDQGWWDPGSGDFCDLGPVRTDVPDGLWFAFAELVDAGQSPKEAFDALVTATLD